jgi:hypothetical protein
MKGLLPKIIFDLFGMRGSKESGVKKITISTKKGKSEKTRVSPQILSGISTLASLGLFFW